MIEPRKAVVEVENYLYATSQLSQTTLRSVLGTAELDDLLSGNAAKPAREQLTLIRIFEELRGRGYEGGYDAVRRYAGRWGQAGWASDGCGLCPTELWSGGLISALGIPPEDFFQIIHVLPRGRFLHTPSFLGLNYSDDLIILEITFISGRPKPGPENYSNLVARRARMQGFTGLDYPTRVPEAFEALGRWQRDGSLVHKEDVAYG